MADDLTTDDVIDAAKSPKSATSDGLSAQAHPLPDLIEAQKFAAGQNALAGGKSAWGATRPARVVPPGAV